MNLVSDTGDAKIGTVVVLVAMEAEAAPIVENLELRKDDPPRIKPPAPCVSYSGKHFGVNIHLICNGKCKKFGVDNVGTVPAALTAYLAIQEFQPDLLLSVGTAGGFKSIGAAIGDVFVGTASAHHDRRIPLPGFDKYGVGLYDAIPTDKLATALQLKTGVVSSGNSLDWVKEDMDLMNANNATVKEMEAAAIAWAAHQFDTPFFSIKAITDIVDDDRATEEEFLENLHAAATALQQTLPKVLEWISNKSLSEL